jgi:hypothetical protein
MPRRGPPNSIRNSKRWAKSQNNAAILRAADKGRNWQRRRLVEDARSKADGEPLRFCAIDAIEDGTVYATLYSDGCAMEFIEVPLTRFTRADRPGLKVGSIFYADSGRPRVEKRKLTKKEIDDARRRARLLFEQINKLPGTESC